MLNNRLITMLLIFMLINSCLCEETVPLKKIIITDKVVYKMRHDFWPKVDERKGIFPFMEMISRKRRSPEIDELPVESEKANEQLDENSTQIYKENDNDDTPSVENYEIAAIEFLTEIPDVDAVTELDSNELYPTEIIPSTDSDANLVVFDLDVAENTLIFRPLFAYRHKKRRQKLNRENNV